MDKKTIKSLIYKAASLLLLAIFLCTSVFIYLQKSFGWFSDNTEVSASGLSVQSSKGLDVKAEFNAPDPDLGGDVVPNIKVEDGEQVSVSFPNLHPGNKFYVNLVLSNSESSNVKITLALKAPTAAEEKAVVTSDGYTYFGAHLRINDVKIYKDGATFQNMTSVKASTFTGQNAFLLTTTPAQSGVGQRTYEQTEFNFGAATNVNKVLTKEIEIAAEGSVTLVFEIEFVDNGEAQNPLIDFAKEGSSQVCTRMLICTTEEVTP
jgi:hypothetical protein